MHILTGKKIQLRALEISDVDLIYKWENDSNFWRVSNTLAPFSKYIIRQFIENSHMDIFQLKQLRLMIEKEDNGIIKTIGSVDLFDYDPLHKRAGIGILIANETDRKNGYASDALEVLIKYSFNTLQLHQVYCNIIEDNYDSLRLFESKGFEISGCKKDWLLFPEGKKNELMLQLINMRNKD